MKRRAFIGMSGTTITSVSGCTLKESNNTGHRFSIYRRMNFEEGLGTLTFWYGYNYLEDGAADARRLFNERLTRWFGEVPEKFKSNEPLITLGPVDELLQILAFKYSKTDKVLGRLLHSMQSFLISFHSGNQTSPNRTNNLLTYGEKLAKFS